MAIFDLKTFMQMNGNGAGPVQALGTAFGMPTCMLNLTDAALGLLPTPILNQIRGSGQSGSNRADDVIKAAFRKLRWLTGIIEIDTDDGIFRFSSDTSKNGIDRNEGGVLNTIGGFLGALGAAAGFAGRLYTNYENISNQINSLTDCIKGYSDYLKYSGGNAANQRQDLANMDPTFFDDYIDSQFGAEKQSIESAIDFRNKADSLVNSINTIIQKRLRDPSLEPEFTYDYLDILSGTGLNVATPSGTRSTEIFRLDFGPPKSTNGRFLLSVDGLYFDSQTSGIVPALLDIREKAKHLLAEDVWKLDYDPNLGGKGKGIGTRDLSLYVNTLLDPDKIDDSKYLRNYYEADIFLNDLIGQKNKRIFDLSSQVVQLEEELSSEAIIANYRQVLLSDNAKFIEKINKRKKQIELAIKMPSIYGKSTHFNPGEIPINDFSYLEGINFLFDIQKQKALVLRQDDVSGVVLPLNSIFVTKKSSSDSVSLDHLLIGEDGVGTIISDSSSVDSVSGVKMSLTDTVVTDGLFAIYNFLQTDVAQPSATEFNLYNGIVGKNENNAILVADRPQYVYFKGLAVPYLMGVTKHSSEEPSKVSAVGSFVKLPESKDFNDFLYSKKGATFESWIHVPDINDYALGYSTNDATVSGLYRLILANENTGLKENVSAQGDILNKSRDSSDNTVRGMVMGFTVDRRITSNAAASNVSGNNPASNACFFIAPTQSYDNSSIGFINRSYVDSNTCNTGTSYHNMKVNIWSPINGVAFSSSGKSYMYLSVVFDTPNDALNVYLDGVLVAASSIRNVFALNENQRINIPSFKKNNSFDYLPTTLNADAPTEIKYGPRLGKYFTPWLLGGGYTDGMYGKGNFMGGTYGGLISGLKGFLGSVKFYNKPLTQSEVLKNFNAQSVFFKNVDISIVDFNTSLREWEYVLVNPV